CRVPARPSCVERSLDREPIRCEHRRAIAIARFCRPGATCMTNERLTGFIVGQRVSVVESLHGLWDGSAVPFDAIVAEVDPVSGRAIAQRMPGFTSYTGDVSPDECVLVKDLPNNRMTAFRIGQRVRAVECLRGYWNDAAGPF